MSLHLYCHSHHHQQFDATAATSPPLFLAREIEWKREKKGLINTLRMNSCSSNLGSDYSLSSVFHSFREASVVRFFKIFAIFGCCIQFIEPTVSALKQIGWSMDHTCEELSLHVQIINGTQKG